MSLASLLVVPNSDAGRNAFGFDHAMSHRNLMVAMGPLNQWSVAPYFVDPWIFAARPATSWPLSHQQAHNDFTTFLPANPAVAPGTVGFPIVQNLLEQDLTREDGLPWWTFANHQEHFIASNAILPLDLTVAQLPWWLLAPRLALTAW